MWSLVRHVAVVSAAAAHRAATGSYRALSSISAAQQLKVENFVGSAAAFEVQVPPSAATQLPSSLSVAQQLELLQSRTGAVQLDHRHLHDRVLLTGVAAESLSLQYKPPVAATALVPSQRSSLTPNELANVSGVAVAYNRFGRRRLGLVVRALSRRLWLLLDPESGALSHENRFRLLFQIPPIVARAPHELASFESFEQGVGFVAAQYSPPDLLLGFSGIETSQTSRDGDQLWNLARMHLARVYQSELEPAASINGKNSTTNNKGSKGTYGSSLNLIAAAAGSSVPLRCITVAEAAQLYFHNGNTAAVARPAELYQAFVMMSKAPLRFRLLNEGQPLFEVLDDKGHRESVSLAAAVKTLQTAPTLKLEQIESSGSSDDAAALARMHDIAERAASMFRATPLAAKAPYATPTVHRTWAALAFLQRVYQRFGHGRFPDAPPSPSIQGAFVDSRGPMLVPKQLAPQQGGSSGIININKQQQQQQQQQQQPEAEGVLLEAPREQDRGPPIAVSGLAAQRNTPVLRTIIQLVKQHDLVGLPRNNDARSKEWDSPAADESRVRALEMLALQASSNYATDYMLQNYLFNTLGLDRATAYDLLVLLGVWSATKLGYWSRLTVHHRHQSFPSHVDDAAKKLAGTVPQHRDEARVQYAELPAYTIDDPSTRHIDDAISLERAADGSEWVHVHIADPSRLISPRSALDVEASLRTTAVYTPEGVHPMVPDCMAAGPLSLTSANATNYAMTFSAKLASSGEILDLKIAMSELHDVRAVPYDSVDRLLASDTAQLSSQREQQDGATMQWLWALAQRRRELRIKNGAVILHIPKPAASVSTESASVRITTDASYARPSRIMVEEMMLLAGEVASRFAHDSRIAIPFRVQEQPLVELGVLRERLGAVGMPAELVPFFSMTFFNAARYSASAGRHFAVGFDQYTRVTSPIRRYADLLAHQQLRSFLETGKAALEHEAVARRVGWLDAITNQVKNNSRLAQRSWILAVLQRLLDGHSMRTNAVVLDWYQELQNLVCEVLLPELAFMRVAILIPLQVFDPAALLLQPPAQQLHMDADAATVVTTPTTNAAAAAGDFSWLRHGVTVPLEILTANPASLQFTLRMVDEQRHQSFETVAWPKAAFAVDAL